MYDTTKLLYDFLALSIEEAPDTVARFYNFHPTFKVFFTEYLSKDKDTLINDLKSRLERTDRNLYRELEKFQDSETHILLPHLLQEIFDKHVSHLDIYQRSFLKHYLLRDIKSISVSTQEVKTI